MINRYRSKGVSTVLKDGKTEKKNKISQLMSKVEWRNYGPHPVIGVDEVGRGCLAGPVYASAVCLRSHEFEDQMTDSKLIAEKKRSLIAENIKSTHWVGIGFATPEEIDEVNILQASFLAMRRAIVDLEEKMGVSAGLLLVDGNQKIPGIETPQITIVKGDLRCTCISAASIVAKVTRDRIMADLAKLHPEYGFESHKGYAAKKHKEAIQKWGPLPFHRKTFAGVKEFLQR